MKFLIIALLLFTLSASAQQPVSPMEYTIKVTAGELDQIGKALGLLPFNDVAALIQKLRTQVIEQQTPKPAEVPK